MSSDKDVSSVDEKILIDLFQRSGRYESIKVIGSGGMADVLKVKDSRLGVLRAIKVLKPELMKHKSVVERFMAEARAMSAIQHASIVQVYDICDMKEGDRILFHYIVLEWCSGGTLDEHIELSGGIPPRQAVETVLFLCQGLRLAHQKNMFHRDIKPDNVLITEDGIAKLADFGIARIEVPGAARHTVTNMGMGSLGFMPPEQFKNAASANAASDIHALGMTLWHMITGERPHPEPSWYNEFQEDDSLMKEVPSILVPILRKATRYKNEERYQTLDVFVKELYETLLMLPPDPEGVLELGSIRPIGEQTFLATESTVDPRPPTRSAEEPVKIGTLHEGNGQVSKVSFTQLPKEFRRSFAPMFISAGLILAILVGVFYFIQGREKESDLKLTATAVAQAPSLPEVVQIPIPTSQAPVSQPVRLADVGVPPSANAIVTEVEANKPKPPVAPRSAKPTDLVRPSAPASMAIAGPMIHVAPPTEPPPTSVSQDVRVGVSLPKGDTAKVWIEGSSGKRLLPTSVPPGIYKVIAQFDGREPVIVIPNLKITDTPVTLQCKSSFEVCKL